MRAKLSWIAVATVLLAGCGGGTRQPASAEPEGLALVAVQPTQAASLSQSRMPGCSWCTSAFSAEFAITSPETLAGVNVWLDGWSGNRRCIYSQHDSPADGFTLAGGAPVIVRFSQASVDCEAPFTIDRIDARARSGDTLVYQGSWMVRLDFRE